MAADENATQLLIEAWSEFVSRLPTGSIEHADGVVATFGNVGLPFLNVCTHPVPLSDAAEVSACLRTAKHLGARCGHPWMFALCEDWAPDKWEAAVEVEGLDLAMTVTEMATDELLPPRRPSPELEFRRTDDEKTATDLAHINAYAYAMPLSLVESICNLDLWRERSYGYVGYVNDEPLSCAAAFPVDATTYVAFVATHPQHHRKGYTEAAMRLAIEAGTNGFGSTRTTLHATAAGMPLYAAMGYHGGRRFHLLTEPHDQ